ncbi:frizzled-10-B-like isoform X2 [Neodiprion pinetum]|nr:frizzled-9-like isoform X2 [Neodiprion fabricii]XP_046472898.1 frizzled-9-like isoform X2 [Neodiprion pinetum]XP_046590357.1 frizzled-9 isoform X2 [Neodiprion lecontei]XP_046610575.1 frizzled-9-like isoform X2 [Neodiprion virginianus]XP_046610576.1 frizzled-9-like isoform X2 [Neodiprion virginianus]
MCRGLGYNLTAMPNFMGHEDQILAERGLTALMPLVHYNCSRHLKFFLCSVFAPVCSEHIAMQIPACKPLCLSVRRDCEPALSSLNLPWPHMLDCERFPDGKTVTLCVQPVAEEILQPADQVPASIPSLQPSIQQQIPQQWPVVQSVQTAQPIIPVRGNNLHHHRCPPHFVQTPDVETITCAPRCGSDVYFRSEDKKFAERWMIGWAWLCFLSTLFTLLTFWVEPSRFRYPERPIVFLALCYNLLSVAYTIRGAVGPENLSCATQENGPSYVPVHDGLRSIPCTLWWLARHYLALASSAWWAVLCGCWLLSARNEWSSEALHNIAPYLHATAWGIPALLTGGSLLSRSVAADELTGLCQISDESALWLEVLPHATLLLLGCIFASIAGAALVRVRRAVRLAGRSATKLERLMTRLGIFALLYALPALGGLACVLHESSVRPSWRTLALLTALDCRVTQNCSPGPSYRAAGLEVVFLRLFLSLVVGVTSGMWVWSGKTCRAWSRLLAAPSKPLRPPEVMQPLGYNMFQGYKPDSGNTA